MFHVFDRTKLIYSGELSQVTRFVLDRYDMKIDKTIHSGIRILYSDSLRSVNESLRLSPPHTEISNQVGWDMDS